VPAIGTYVEAPQEAPARLPVSLPPRPAALASREDLLASLDELLAQDGAPRAVVLSGMGGVGKTSLPKNGHVGGWVVRKTLPCVCLPEPR
jgi:hypothetical protein